MLLVIVENLHVKWREYIRNIAFDGMNPFNRFGHCWQGQYLLTVTNCLVQSSNKQMLSIHWMPSMR